MELADQRFYILNTSILKSINAIVVTGPECAGKTMLSKELSRNLDCPWVPEYSVEYLDTLSRIYELKDLVEIAVEQRQRIFDAAGESEIVVADTACLVLKVWAEVKYKEVPAAIEDWWKETKDYIYLLCTPDLPWESGQYRENPNDRDELFEKYRQHLSEGDRKFAVINGRNRLRQALEFLEVSGHI